MDCATRLDTGHYGDRDSVTLERLNEMKRALSGDSALGIPTEEESWSRWLYALWEFAYHVSIIDHIYNCHRPCLWILGVRWGAAYASIRV